ncbi:Hint domain-containing protein [Thalassovita mediterranea]|uniref:Hemolysin IA n=1 Tax=Thalassovita mediterranea TaxID=340021 RepID=A0A0P1GMN0_9RHOB|nr:Hint domain-containing protein [Thalassovita mediterranea]CUH83472.1 Hemolysin IA [Thalassovita mediterranea]SIS34980.1 Ca2+-binding protein, RTX toxin-related [Thalassovita mediterranea]
MNGTFLTYGNDLLTGATVAASGDQLTINSGSAAFGDGQVLIWDVVDAADDGSFTSATTITGVTVYASYADYQAANPLYTYGGTASVGTAAADMGNAYLTLDLSSFAAPQTGAPVLSTTVVAPGSDLTAEGLPQTLDQMQDLDGAGGATADGVFTLDAAHLAYHGGGNERYVIDGTDGDDAIGYDLAPDADGDRRDSGDAADGSDDDVIRAGAGNDSVFAGMGNDVVFGGHGNDSLLTGEGDDTIHGGAGDDTVRAGVGADHIYGGNGNDSIEGFDGGDYIVGGDGDDWMNGDRGSDTMFGGAGNDWMRGSFGNEWMEGGTGNDFIWSGYGDDTIRLENDFGNDTIEMEGIDEVTGDVLDLTAITDDLTIDLSHNLEGWGSLSDGTYTATYEDVENLRLGSGNDTLRMADYGGRDAVQGFRLPDENPDGSFTVYDRFDLSAMTDEGGEALGPGDLRIQVDTDGSVMLLFPKAESITLTGITPDQITGSDMLEAMGLPATEVVVPGSDGVVRGTDGDDTIDGDYTGDADGDVVDGGDNETPGEGADDDHIEAGDGNDLIRAGVGDDLIYAGEGNDTIYAGDGHDEVRAGAGDDLMIGGIGNDSMYAGEGNDTLIGGGGSGWIHGEAGNDAFSIGDGDIAFGGSGDDIFEIQYDTLGFDVEMTITGGEDGESAGDHLKILGPATITYDPDDPEAGTVSWDNGARLYFSEIEKVHHVPCFTADTMILTRDGERRAADLQVGDMVMTRDAGFQPIRWIGSRRLGAAEVAAMPDLRPVHIRAGSLGAERPSRDLTVSPQHRMLVRDPKVSLWFGEEEVLVPAVQLTCLDGVQRGETAPVTYVHLMFDQHQLVLGDGAWSESFQPGDYTLAGLDAPQREELFKLFPELAVEATAYSAARPTLSRHEVAVLFA